MNNKSIMIINGHVQTLDEQSSTAEAIFIKNNKIYKVGSESEILKLKEDSTKVISANGGTIMPGFIDSHVHLFPGSDGLNKLDLDNVTTLLFTFVYMGGELGSLEKLDNTENITTL